MSNDEQSWSSKKYNEYYNSYVPWLEDKYLAWFGENKVSYTAKDQLGKTKITGNEGVDKLQDGVNDTVGGQLGSKGMLGGVTDQASKEGVNRAERGDTGPLDTEQAKQAQKGWGETLSFGYVGGGKK